MHWVALLLIFHFYPSLSMKNSLLNTILSLFFSLGSFLNGSFISPMEDDTILNNVGEM